jgi:hypothetical protein
MAVISIARVRYCSDPRHRGYLRDRMHRGAGVWFGARVPSARVRDTGGYGIIWGISSPRTSTHSIKRRAIRPVGSRLLLTAVHFDVDRRASILWRVISPRTRPRWFNSLGLGVSWIGSYACHLRHAAAVRRRDATTASASILAWQPPALAAAGYNDKLYTRLRTYIAQLVLGACCTHDALVFSLRIIAAACRVGGSYVCLPFRDTYYTIKVFIFHSHYTYLIVMVFIAYYIIYTCTHI